jgi:protein-tyrosine-phosphatase
MEKEPLRVLFLCTGNSARSQMGEALLRHMSRGEIEVVSAGSRPRPEVHPMASRAVKKLFGSIGIS